jgi:hypothetical protein
VLTYTNIRQVCLFHDEGGGLYPGESWVSIPLFKNPVYKCEPYLSVPYAQWSKAAISESYRNFKRRKGAFSLITGQGYFVWVTIHVSEEKKSN